MTVGNIQRSREIGDKVGLRWTPSNYTPATVSGYSDATTQLTSHLAGIDTKFGSVASVVSSTVTSAIIVDQYDAVYIDTSVGKLRKSANNQTALVANFFGIVIESGGIAQDASGVVVINGAVTNIAWNWVPFQWVYVGSTAGTLTQTIPTTNGQYVVPVGVALSATVIQVTPATGWEVSGNYPSSGVGKLAFTEATTVGTIVVPSPNATITQVVVVVTVAASAGGATISVGTPTSPTIDIDTSYVDLMEIGTYIYEPYHDCGAIPSSEIITVVAGGQTFSGTVYVFYNVPSQLTGRSGLTKLSFTEATSSPYVLLNPPNGTTISEVICVVDTAAAGGSPTLSVGVSGTVDRDFKTTDNDLKTAGIYTYQPMTECGNNAAPIIMTLVVDSQTFIGRIYIRYIIPD